MAEERMPAKQYAKFEKTFYLYGSTSKMVGPVRPDEWQKLAEEMLAWSKRKVSDLVDEYAVISALPPVETPVDKEPEPPKTLPALKPSQDVLGETDTITVKSVTLQSKGVTKAGREWKLYKITDNHDTNYFTFHTSFKIGETYDVDWEWQEKNGRKSRTIKTAPRPINGSDVDDVPF